MIALILQAAVLAASPSYDAEGVFEGKKGQLFVEHHQGSKYSLGWGRDGARMIGLLKDHDLTTEPSRESPRGLKLSFSDDWSKVLVGSEGQFFPYRRVAAEEPKKAAEAGAAKEAKFTEAKKLFAEQQWDQARARFEEARGSVPPELIAPYLSEIARELVAKRLMDEAEAALVRSEFAAAKKSLDAVSTGQQTQRLAELKKRLSR